MPSLRRSLRAVDEEELGERRGGEGDTPVELPRETQTRADTAHHARDDLWGG